ncbi:MAG: acylphosphatase [Acidobacteriota bacterium]
MQVTRRYLISGRVQGVGFRFFAADAARREGLAGHVRNLVDGLVEVVAEGDLDSVTRFEAKLWRGPSHARVDDVVVTDTEPLGLTDGFAIR